MRPSVETARLLGENCAELTDKGLTIELLVSALNRVPPGEKVW
jgi:hypothetical protein